MLKQFLRRKHSCYRTIGYPDAIFKRAKILKFVDKIGKKIHDLGWAKELFYTIP